MAKENPTWGQSRVAADLYLKAEHSGVPSNRPKVGWTVNDRVEFNFRDAYDIGTMTGRAQAEAYVKSELRKRMEASN